MATNFLLRLLECVAHLKIIARRSLPSIIPDRLVTLSNLPSPPLLCTQPLQRPRHRLALLRSQIPPQLPLRLIRFTGSLLRIQAFESVTVLPSAHSPHIRITAHG